MQHLITYRGDRMIAIDTALVKALVGKLGGKTTVSEADARPYAWGSRMELRVSKDDAQVVHLELIDPAAPVEGAHYWVKVLGGINAEWKAAHYVGGHFHITGSPAPYAPGAVEIGDRIPTPEQPDKSMQRPNGPPAGYVALDEGVRCRCLRLRRDSAGIYWCCGGGTADKTAAENPDGN